MKKRVTLDDVSRAAGVSPITVSRSLRKPEMVSEKIRDRVQRAVRILGYVPNTAAQFLATGRSNVIGVVIPSVTNNVFADVLRGIYAEIEQSSFQVQVVNSRYSAKIEEGLLRLFQSQSPAGMIVAGFDQTEAAREILKSIDCPLVQIMECGPDPIDHSIGFSHFDAAAAATRHLLDQGYRKLGFIGARMDPRTRSRFSGFRKTALAAASFDDARVIQTDEASSVALGAALFSRLRRQAPEVDAVFCNNDDLALGVLFEALRQQIPVPDQLGICGFNDLEMMAAAEPPITSVHTPRYDIGRDAIRYILARLEDGARPAEAVDTGYKVVARQSTRKLASSTAKD
ncbi:HTH-type transcriptional regulator GntR [Marivivens aquimaris]|uniref:LacI family DNA-binding transcriptional regulator n=1 Tax=Marivivens aquimaris TaxID=2774876 RepID=UPI00187DFB12|nr:LacI family DNA-binding transcriptional regulator [Marivivens aquimaris]